LCAKQALNWCLAFPRVYSQAAFLASFCPCESRTPSPVPGL
jgi:hypothetical protein